MLWAYCVNLTMVDMKMLKENNTLVSAWGRYSVYFWVGVCRWDSGALTPYQGQGGGGLKLPLPTSSFPSSCNFHSRFPPLYGVVSSSLSHFYSEIKQNVGKFSQFLPVPATLGLLLSALSSPPSCPFSPRLPPSCPHPLYQTSFS